MRTPRCAACRLHQPDCLCALLPRLSNTTPVTIVVHARDADRPSNTGWLVERVLARSTMVVHGGRGVPFDGSRPKGPERQEPALAGACLVLHPDGRPLGPGDREAAHLIVPDGSWSQVRRMLHRVDTLASGELVALPRERTQRAWPSTLAMRREPAEGWVCTFEAVARALGVLESKDLEAKMLDVLSEVVRRARQRRSSRVALR